ncbi:MAG: Rqc2 family fibronectin-binding protein [Anaerolineae bacterium]
MSQDSLTLAAVRDELAGLLTGGRVQRIVRPSALSLGLEIYTGQRYQLLLDAEPNGNGIALSDERLRRGVESASPLQLLLRKHVEGARLLAITQPGLERILRFSFAGAEGSVDLVCEIMGRLSNLILVGADRVILDAAKRVPARINRYRTVLPGHPYVPPPPQNKLPVAALDQATLRAALDAQSGPVARRLVQAVGGMSPVLAQEICHRSTGDQAMDWPLEDARLERLYAVLLELLRLPETGAWSPSIGYQMQDGQRVAVAVAPYALTHCESWEPVASIARSALLSLGHARQHDPYAGARAELSAIVGEQAGRQRARMAALERANVTPEELAALQLQGDAILAMAWAIAPGQRELVVRRGDVTGEGEPVGDAELCIPLDPALSATENAQAVFRSYRKRQSAGEQVPERMAEAEQELAYLAQLQSDIDLAEDRPALEAVRDALHEAGYLPEQRRRIKQASAGPLQIRTSRGALILVGRNAAQNEVVTHRLSGPQDIWLHARGVPGAHVVLKSGGVPADERDLERAAALAAHYSSARGEGRVTVDLTERRNVRRIPNGRPGMVTYRGESTLTVLPRGPDDPDPAEEE